jgi:DNA topoisomerase-1
MANNLVIVESRGKIASITKYLNSSKELKPLGKFVVMASFGHIYELKKPGLGIDIENGFKPIYDVIPDKKKIIDDLIKKSKSVNNVYLASDSDFEGEAISNSLKDALKLKKYKRIIFTEITQKALENAIKNAGLIDEKKVAAQETRRVLDRLVGFKLSPLLWKKFTTGNQSTLSAGRVQSAALHMIIRKEQEIKNFISKPYWNVSGEFTMTVSKDKKELKDVKLYNGDTIQKFSTIKDVTTLLKKNQNKFTINNVKTKITKQNADLPYITSSLQQDAYSKLGFALKRTMALAQGLYEAGLITYMRTDSYNISEDFKELAGKYIIETYGENYYEEGGSKKTKAAVKGAQAAHEAIRITNPSIVNIDGKYEKDMKSLYELIWKRTLAYLMKPCIYDELEICIADNSFTKDMAFISTFKKVKFNGFQIVYGVNNDKYNFIDYLEFLKKGNYTLSCDLIFSKNIWASPPQRFNDASIVKALENDGIGRPSTFATIMAKLFERKYVLKSNIEGDKKTVEHIKFIPKTSKITIEKDTTMVGADKTKIVPTDIGIEIDKFLEKHFEYIVDKNFTASMENDLDNIAEGTKKKNDVLNLFWEKFNGDLSLIDNGPKEKKIVLKTEQTEIDVDGQKYIVRLAKFGPVLQFIKPGAISKTNSKGKDEPIYTYIPLKGYLLLLKKQYIDIDENDIEFLTTLPRELMKIKNVHVMLTIGPFGLYLKYDGKNVSITKKFAYKIIKKENFDNKEILDMIEYNANKPPKVNDDKYQKIENKIPIKTPIVKSSKKKI